MPHQTKPNDPASYSYGHTIGDFPELAYALGQGKKAPTLEDIAKMRGQKLQGTTFVDTNNTDNFINQANQFGVSGTNMNALGFGGLSKFIPQAQNIYTQLLSKSPEQQAKEDRINTGLLFLNFFSNLGAQSSQLGATGLGATNVAIQDTANKYIQQVEANRKRKDAERKGVVNLAMQMKATSDARELAKLKLRPKVVPLYKIDKEKEGEPVKNVVEGSPEYLNLTSVGGNYSVVAPKVPDIYEDDFGVKRYKSGPFANQKVSDVINSDKVAKGENLETESENEEGENNSSIPNLKKLTKVEMGYVKQYRAEIEKLTKDFRDIQSGYQKIVKFYNTKGAIGDYGLAVQFAKLIDPGSVAREGEVAAVQRAGSLPDTLKAQLINAINGKGGLPERVRAGIYNRAIEIFNTERTKAIDVVNKFKGLLASDLGDNTQGGRLEFFTIEPEVPTSQLIDLSQIKDKDFVYNEQEIEKMTVQELTTVLQQDLTTEQTQFILKILKKKKKANKEANQGTN